MDDSTLQPAPASEPAEPAPGSENGPGLPAGVPASDASAFEPPAKKRSPWLFAGVGLLVILLAAAAYVGGKWLGRPPAGQAAGPSGGQKLMMSKDGGASRSISIEPAKELPQSSPDLRGVLVRRQDNSLFVGTGKVTRIVQQGDRGAQAPAPAYDGPVLEAVVTHDTQIYRDETNLAAPPPGPSDTIPQVVKPGSLDEITANSLIQVWGERTGDRYVARILVYQPG